MRAPRTVAFGFAVVAIACDPSGMDIALSKRAGLPRDLVLGQRLPDAAEAAVVGPRARACLQGAGFRRLVRYERGSFLCRDEGEPCGSMMTLRLRIARRDSQQSADGPDPLRCVTEAFE
jgi:hypothetical protein